MSSYDSLLSSQSANLDAIKKLNENFKKDSPTRKTTLEYHDDRLEKLEGLWSEFKKNDVQLSLLKVEKSGAYFENRVYERLEQLYEETKCMINKSKQRLLAKIEDERFESISEVQGQGEGSAMRTAGKSSVQQDSNEIAEDMKNTSYEVSVLNQRTKDVMNEQRSNIKAFERAVRNMDIENLKEKWQLEDKLRTVTQRWEKVDNTYWKLDNILDDMQTFESDYNRLERLYEFSKEQINKKIWENKHQEKSTPKIELPIFSGSYAQWTTFKDLFIEIVHRNTFISNAQKMQHLKSKLKGEPERLIQHMNISADNYETCWKILQQRYDNKRLLFSYQANILLNQPNIQTPTASQLKRMHDTTMECIEAIKNLHFDTSTWDPLVVYILMQKLDSETTQSFIESLDEPRSMPTLSEFLKFIETKFMSMESSTNTNRPRNINSQHQNIQPKTVHNAIYSKPKMQQQSISPETKNMPRTFHAKKTFHNFVITCPKCNKQHGLYNCREFLSMPPEERLKTAKNLHVCLNCLFSHKGEKCVSEKKCKHCEEPHSSILHEAIEIAKSRPSTSNVGQRLSTYVTHDNSNEVLLATAQVKIIANDGTTILLRALLDQGSQVSLITENAAQRLQLKRNKMSAVVSRVGASATTKCKGVLQLKCQALYNNYHININAFIMKSITNKLPSKTVDKGNFEHIKHLQLADPDFNISQDIDVLLGAEVYSEILLEGLIKTNTSSIIAQQTQLGWVVCGNYKTFNCHVIVNNVQDLAQFWEQESLQDNKEVIDPNNKCEHLYTETTSRLPDGRYQVRLPLKDNFIDRLETSKPQAIAQFQQLERKMEKNRAFGKDYKEFIDEYEKMGHMKKVEPNTNHNNIEYFLPHHGVVRPGAITTKMRVVFNASAKTSSKHSLNDLMEAGPNLQKDILSILLKWRQYKYVLTSDIEKMYRFIVVHPEHQPLQKIVWRDSPRKLLREYQLCTVTYGTKAAPFLALRTLQQLAMDEGDKFPDAKNILLNQFFVDDALFGKDTVDEARSTRDQLIQLLKKGGFNLRKWSSNDHQLLDDLPKDMVSPASFNFTEASTSKALGLAWNPKQDAFIFTPTLKNKNNISKNSSKRQILSDISTIFDPLGLLSPITIKAKILFQQIWKHKIEWDDAVPDGVEKEWRTLRNELTNMQPFKINRWIGFETNKTCELHAFCDASERAFSCVVYSKVREGTQKPRITLIAAKTKVAPIQKQQTLPRLELCGAQLLVQLVKKIKHCLDQQNIKVTAWTDSMIVLGWLNGDISRWKAYVGHRVQEIISVVPAQNWKHVRSEQNPADCASRGLLPSQLHNFTLWFDGPEWLHSEDIPETCDTYLEPEQEVKKVHAVTSQTIENKNDIVTQLLIANSCIMTVIRIVAWVSRFITKTSRKHRHGEDATMTQVNDQRASKHCNLTPAEIRRATVIVIKHVQSEHYEQEIKDLKIKGKVSNNSKLLKLNPHLDGDNILRVGGRLQHSNLPEETKHPIIIPKNSLLTYLLINRAHATTLHGGARLTLATLRQKYWIIGGNNTVKKYLQNCVKCCRFKPSKQYQLMADLPSERITQSPPFHHTGVDYTGFVNVKLNKGRGVRTSKGYVVVFVCMTTKAVHLELASDLSTQTFILALNRMIARRGCPKHIYSDNGTNFVGAEKELARQLHMAQTFNSDTLSRKNAEMGIEWHFNAPSWPTAGGLWEAAVKSMKYHLKRVLGEQKLTYEEFSTLLTQIEACMNSRPLCPLTEDIEDIDYLTPSHFLIGRPATFLPQENIEEQNINIRHRWQLLAKMQQGFWTRWSSEYLQQLQARSKWLHKTDNFAIGDVVLIKEDNLPPAKWALGRIQDVHPGRDNLVRVVTMKTKTGLLTRPITKLAKLPIPGPQIEKQDTTTLYGTKRAENQNPIKNNTKQKQRSKQISRAIGSNLLCMLITLLTLFQPTKQVSDVINVAPFEPNRAVYFDKIGNLQTVHDDWKIVTYYNMTSYWQGIENIHRVVNHLGERCEQFAYQTMCKTIMTEFRQELNELDHNNYMLETHHGQIRGRVTRGLINGVGYLANSLFGVLDERFAIQYKQDIEKLHNNRDHLLKLIKGQISIIEAQNNILKRNEEAMNTQFSLISEHLNTTDAYLQKVGKAVQQDEALNYFNIMSVTSSIILSKLRHIQLMLLDTAINIHHGHVDTRLLPQSQLFQELNIISGQLPQHLSIPVDNIQNQLADIYKLLEVKSRLLDQYFIIEITLPLTGDTPFTIYKTVPIPMITDINHSLVMKTSSEYVAVNIRKETYMQLAGNDLQQCIKIEPSTYVCSLNKPTRNMRNHQSPCEIGAITNVTLSKCIYTSETCNSKWTPLRKPNTWLYVCCTDCQLQIICEGRMTVKAIHSTGILEAKEGCIIRNNEETYYTQVYYTNNVYVNPELSLIDLDDINNLTSVQPIDLSVVQQNTHFIRNDYEKLHNSLKELEDQTKQAEMSQHDVHQYIVSYTTMGLLILLAAVAGGAYVYRKRCGKVTVNAGASNRLPPRKPPRAAASTENIEMNTIRDTYATPHSFNI